MDIYPKTTFVYSPRSEAERIIYTLIVILQGFYEKHGFLVLPTSAGRMDGNTLVSLPDLPYQQIPGLWQKLQGLKSEIPPAVPEQLIEQIAELLGDKELKEEPVQLQAWRSEWSAVERAYWAAIEKYFPRYREYLGNLEVRYTLYGTGTSGSWLRKDSIKQQYFYLREDRGIESLAAMIVNLLLQRERTDLGITWSKREMIMDFVMTRGEMSKLFPKYKPIMYQLAKTPPKLKRQSQEYQMKLGIPKFVPELYVSAKNVYIKGEKVSTQLTRNTRKIITLLYLKRGEIVSYDELSDCLWGEGEFRTFWAINKQIARLRTKLAELGVVGSKIKPVRGIGYTLID